MDLAAYLDCVSSSLLEVASALRKGEVPTFSLAKLKSYSLQLPRLLGSVVDESTSRRFALGIINWSGSAGDLLKEHQEIAEELGPEYDIATQYEELAGHIKALADGIRVAPDAMQIEEAVTAKSKAAFSDFFQMLKIDKDAKS
jgi:hypothetical protein